MTAARRASPATSLALVFSFHSLSPPLQQTWEYSYALKSIFIPSGQSPNPSCDTPVYVLRSLAFILAGCVVILVPGGAGVHRWNGEKLSSSKKLLIYSQITLLSEPCFVHSLGEGGWSFWMQSIRAFRKGSRPCSSVSFSRNYVNYLEKNI